MADDEVKYELTTVRAIRGTEAKTTAKWQDDGWEFVSQSQGLLQSQITFRRPKAKPQWNLFAVLGGVLAFLAIVIIIGVNVIGGGS
jgi:hypothetical protein